MSSSKSVPDPSASFFPWSQAEHSVHISLFDEEHKRIFSQISSIHTASKERNNRPHLQLLMEKVIKETRSHFDHEEQVLRESDFEGWQEHAAQHEASVKEALHLAKQFRDGYISAMILPTFLRNWFIGHIQESDRRYTKHLQGLGHL